MDNIDHYWRSPESRKIILLPGAFHARPGGSQTGVVRRLQEENCELRIRLGSLIRLLIERGVFSADDYAAMVRDTKAKITTPGSRE